MSLITRPVLCYVTDRRAFRAEDDPGRVRALLDRIERAAAAGVDWVQIREKDLATLALGQIASAAVRAAAGSSTRILLNDRLDIALAAGAAGVHLGGESAPVAEVARWKRASVLLGRAPGDFLIGASCHSLEAARAAERDGADYVIFGPIFATPSKMQFGPPQGLERLAEVCRALRIPVLAIGGITVESAHACRSAGAAGLTAIRMFQEAADLDSVVALLRRGTL